MLESYCNFINLSFNKMTMSYCKEQRKNLFYDLSRQIVIQYICRSHTVKLVFL